MPGNKILHKKPKIFSPYIFSIGEINSKTFFKNDIDRNMFQKKVKEVDNE